MTGIGNGDAVGQPGVDLDAYRTATLEAYADTIVPGEKRRPDDRAVAGAVTGSGAVAAGVVDLLHLESTGIAERLGDLSLLLNEYARCYAAELGIDLDTSVPPFVALDFGHRTGLVERLTAPGHPDSDSWVVLALFADIAIPDIAHPQEGGWWRFEHTAGRTDALIAGGRQRT